LDPLRDDLIRRVGHSHGIATEAIRELILTELHRLAETLSSKQRRTAARFAWDVRMAFRGAHIFRPEICPVVRRDQAQHQQLTNAIAEVAVGQFSGAVGNYAHLNPQVELLACKNLDLTPVNISTQVIQRDRHAQFLSVLA
jgi:adenylosuccinate lyase